MCYFFLRGYRAISNFEKLLNEIANSMFFVSLLTVYTVNHYIFLIDNFDLLHNFKVFSTFLS